MYYMCLPGVSVTYLQCLSEHYINVVLNPQSGTPNINHKILNLKFPEGGIFYKRKKIK